MTKELVELLQSTEVKDFSNFKKIPADLTSILQSLKFMYSEEDINALANWQLEDIVDTNLQQWVFALVERLEEVSQLDINNIDLLISTYCNIYGNRVIKLQNTVRERLEQAKIDLKYQNIVDGVYTVADIVRDILGESNTDKTIDELGDYIYSMLYKNN